MKRGINKENELPLSFMVIRNSNWSSKIYGLKVGYDKGNIKII